MRAQSIIKKTSLHLIVNQTKKLRIVKQLLKLFKSLLGTWTTLDVEKTLVARDMIGSKRQSKNDMTTSNR